jgi:putative ABC transport system permease protein
LGFIMGVVIVLKQYRASLNYNFGFEQANILDVELQDIDIERFRHAFSTVGAVQGISMSSGIIGTSLPPQSTIQRQENSADSAVVYQFHIDSDYLANLKIKLIAGNSFPEFNGSPREHYIIVNEEFLKQFKIATASQALNQSFVLDDSIQVKVIGVTENFHYTRLTEPIRSFIFRSDPHKLTVANLNVRSEDMYSTIEQMESAWKSIGATTPFRSRFFQDEIQEAYSFYFSLIKICGFLGFLAITISCLGLLGMVVYTTENRMKELGIRKVMGADSVQLAVLLSKGYMKLMAIAALIATPVTYLIFDKGMLQMQYYRFEIGAGEIVISLMIMLVLGAATILSQTIKAASTNPVDTLKSE